MFLPHRDSSGVELARCCFAGGCLVTGVAYHGSADAAAASITHERNTKCYCRGQCPRVHNKPGCLGPTPLLERFTVLSPGLGVWAPSLHSTQSSARRCHNSLVKRNMHGRDHRERPFVVGHNCSHLHQRKYCGAQFLP